MLQSFHSETADIMNTQRIFRTSLCLIVALAVQSCGSVPVSTQAPQPVPPQQLGTIVAQTAAAARTQTALFLPSPTTSSTPTRTPSKTPTPATPTQTFFFALPTRTPTLTQTLPPVIGGSGSGTAGPTTRPRNGGMTNLPWSCGIQDRSFPSVAPKEHFSIFVTLRNTGTRSWTINTIDYVYTGGYRHEGTKIIDFPENASTGSTITLRVDFQAPKEPKTYNSLWVLKVGNHPFCGFRLSFQVVRE